MHHDGVEFLFPLIMFPFHIGYGGSMEEQQTFLLLRFCLDVAGARGGTSMVQGDCSLILDAQVAPSSWEGLYICNNMMGGVFGKIHVEEGGFKLTVALLQRPATLSLESLD